MRWGTPAVLRIGEGIGKGTAAVGEREDAAQSIEERVHGPGVRDQGQRLIHAQAVGVALQDRLRGGADELEGVGAIVDVGGVATARRGVQHGGIIFPKGKIPTLSRRACDKGGATAEICFLETRKDGPAPVLTSRGADCKARSREPARSRRCRANRARSKSQRSRTPLGGPESR